MNWSTKIKNFPESLLRDHRGIQHQGVQDRFLKGDLTFEKFVKISKVNHSVLAAKWGGGVHWDQRGGQR